MGLLSHKISLQVLQKSIARILEMEGEKKNLRERGLGGGGAWLYSSVMSSARATQGGAPSFSLARPAALPLFLSLQAIL